MPSLGPRRTLLVAFVCIGLGLAIIGHNRHIEASGFEAPLFWGGPSQSEIPFRPHWSSLHFVSLVLSLPEHLPRARDLDRQGFPRRGIDLRWEVRDERGVVSGGGVEASRMRIARGDERVVLLGAFRADARTRYTVNFVTGGESRELADFASRVEVGRRPGPPLLLYSLGGQALLLVGAVFLFTFTRRREKSWPYLQILNWVQTRRTG